MSVTRMDLFRIDKWQCQARVFSSDIFILVFKNKSVDYLRGMMIKGDQERPSSNHL